MDDVFGILAGPRGRRLCLEVATEIGDDVCRESLFWLSHKHAAHPGKIIGFGWKATSKAVAERADAVHLSDLTDAIAAADLTAIDGALVARAFARSVGAAMYWQEPDGDDTVAGLPEVIEALRPVAGAIDALPETAWWRAGVRSPQWAVEWGALESIGPVEVGGVEGLDLWRAEVVAGNERAAAERPDDPTSNWSGSWWSKPGHVVVTSGEDADGVPACITMVEDGFGWTDAAAIRMGGAGRVFEIHTPDDWAELCRAYPLDTTHEHRHDWFRATGRDGAWVEPDWRAVASDWDAVHLTASAYLAGATRAIPVDEVRASVIAGWGPDATYWLTGRVRELGEIVRWRRDEQDEVWVRAASD